MSSGFRQSVEEKEWWDKPVCDSLNSGVLIEKPGILVNTVKFMSAPQIISGNSAISGNSDMLIPYAEVIIRPAMTSYTPLNSFVTELGVRGGQLQSGRVMLAEVIIADTVRSSHGDINRLAGEM